jgi:hypothetical protein
MQDVFSGKTDFDLDHVATRQMFITFFEGLGMLVKRGLIDIEMVEDLFSGRIIWYWETQVAPYVDKVRQNLNDPTQADSIEYLYNVMKQRAGKQVV